MTDLAGATTLHPTDFPQPTVVHVNGVDLEVFEAGREHAGNPIVLCHGWPELAYTWRHQVPALAAAGYHVIVPNQRGFGGSSRPTEVTAYDIEHLTGDLVALLDHYGDEDAVFVGHDWGANVVWGLAQLHPDRVRAIINLSLPYLERGERPWIEVLEVMLGPDYYFVHFNRQPGVADKILEANTERFLRNLYRRDLPLDVGPLTSMIDLATQATAAGEPVMRDDELAVYIAAFERSGFSGSIDWYRNLDRNWHLLADADPIIEQPTLMIYGERDPVMRTQDLARFVPNVEEVSLDCGHWLPEERPQETNRVIVDWLARQVAHTRSA